MIKISISSFKWLFQTARHVLKGIDLGMLLVIRSNNISTNHTACNMRLMLNGCTMQQCLPISTQYISQKPVLHFELNYILSNKFSILREKTSSFHASFVIFRMRFSRLENPHSYYHIDKQKRFNNFIPYV